MNEYDDMSQYNGDAEHNMWVDFTDYMNTGELADLFEEDYDDYEEDEYDDDTY